MNRGRQALDQFLARLRDDLDAQPVLTRCAFCAWNHTGTLAEGRAAHRAHRTKHPQARAGKRSTPKNHMVMGSDIHANIKATRAQGGHSFEEAAA